MVPNGFLNIGAVIKTLRLEAQIEIRFYGTDIDAALRDSTNIFAIRD